MTGTIESKLDLELKPGEEEKKKSFGRRVGTRVRRDFIIGLLIVIPLGVTIFILEWSLSLIDNLLQPLIRVVHGNDIPGLGLAVTIAFVFIIGAVASNVFGKRLINFLETPLHRIPVLRTIYVGTKQILESFSSSEKKSFRQVVLVEFPSKGIQSVGFVTNITRDAAGNKAYYVLIPTAPNPASGFLVIVKEEDIIPTKLSMDDAIAIIVSAGTFTHKDIDRLEGKAVPPDNNKAT